MGDLCAVSEIGRCVLEAQNRRLCRAHYTRGLRCGVKASIIDGVVVYSQAQLLLLATDRRAGSHGKLAGERPKRVSAREVLEAVRKLAQLIDERLPPPIPR